MSLVKAHELFLFLVVPCALMAGTSYAYFAADRHSSSLRRLATSAHGAVATLLYVAAIVICWLTPRPRPDIASVLAILYIVPVGLIVVSAIWYRGPKDVHLLQLANLPTIAFTAFIGLFGVGVRAI